MTLSSQSFYHPSTLILNNLKYLLLPFILHFWAKNHIFGNTVSLIILLYKFILLVHTLTIFRIEKIGIITMFLILILRKLLLPCSLNLISLIISVPLKLKNGAINLTTQSLQSIRSHSHNHLLLFLDVIIFLLLSWVPVHFWPAKSCECLGLSAWVYIVIEHVEDELDAWARSHFVAMLNARGFWYFVLVVERYVGVAYVSFVFIYLMILVVEDCMLVLDKLRLGVLEIWFLKILISLAAIGIVGIRDHFLGYL